MAVAGIAAAAAHTAFPADSVAGAVVAVSRVEVDDWRGRLVGEIARWTKAHPEWTATSQLPSGFEDRLLATLDAHGLAELDPDDPRFRAVFVDALAASVFVPLMDTPGLRADARAAAEALVHALPELLVRSAPDHTPLAPLRQVIGRDVAQVKDELVRLGIVMRQ